MVTGPTGAVDGHALDGVDKLLGVECAGLLVGLGDEFGGDVAVKRSDRGLAIVGRLEIGHKGLVGLAFRVVEEIIGGAQDTFGRVGPNGFSVESSVAVCMKKGTRSLNPVALAAFKNGTQSRPPVAMMTASGLAARMAVM